ncbi:hypothetical protein ACS49_03850 [Bacillus cereus]|nr:hypothetical protein ACS49_03850 [Bacillus cereus]
MAAELHFGAKIVCQAVESGPVQPGGCKSNGAEMERVSRRERGDDQERDRHRLRGKAGRRVRRQGGALSGVGKVRQARETRPLEGQEQKKLC